jgi:outer membrane protein assembly factor BamB
MTGCPRGGAREPAAPPLAAWHLEVEAAGGFDAIALAGDGRVATGYGGVTLASAGQVVWTRPLAEVRALAFAGDAVVAAVTGTGEGFRGDPGAALVALAASDGAERWRRPIGATGWVIVRALAAMPDGDVVAAGSFNGTLRAGDAVVSAGGASDGFVLRAGPAGEVRWLVRIGGERADAIAAVAAAPGRGRGLAVGGTFTGVADARGVALEPVVPEAFRADGFVARLADDGTVSWAKGFGGESDDAVAGVAITRSGLVAVAATLRGDALADGKVVSTRGLADAALITFDDRGSRRAVALIGGNDYDAASALAARGDDLVLAASYSGRVVLGDAALDAAGGDGALIAVLDGSGEAVRVHDVAGVGRESVPALAGAPGGWAAAVRHTAGARVGDTTLTSPADPYAGAGIVVRPE